MILLVGVFLISLIPSILLFIWLRNKVRQPQEEAYRKTAADAMKYGFLSTLVVVLLSGTFSILGAVLKLKNNASIPGTLYHTFIVLAFAEEVAKTFMFYYLLKKKANYKYTWLDMIIFMVIVSLGFGLAEDAIYGIGTGPGQMLVRGVLMMHGGFGFIEGWFYGKAKYTGKKWNAAIGFVIAWLYHGLYDFGLQDILATINENIQAISLVLAGVAFVLVIVMIVFFAKKDKKPQYLEPLQ